MMTRKPPASGEYSQADSPPANGRIPGYKPQRRHDSSPARRTVTEPVALDDDERPVRLSSFHRNCGAVLFIGYHDFDGERWTPRWFSDRDPKAGPLSACPGCGAELLRDDVISPSEMDVLREGARERACRGEAIDDVTIAALMAELSRGLTLEKAAPFYGRKPVALRAEIRAWMDSAAGKMTKPEPSPRDSPRGNMAGNDE